MGIGDSIRNAAENAMKDLGGTAERPDDGHVPEPGAPDEEIKVHSSISEASNTMESAEDERGGSPGEGAGSPARGARAEGEGGTGGNILPDDSGNGSGMPAAPNGPAGAGESGAGQSGAPDTGEETAAPARSVPGPGGLPDPDPDVLRADPTEADQDPSTGMGRG